VAYRDGLELRLAPGKIIDISWSGALVATSAPLSVGRLAYLAPLADGSAILVRVARCELGRDYRRRFGVMCLDDAIPVDSLESSASDSHWAAALDVGWPCSLTDLRSAYRRLARVHHPDRGGDPAAFVRLKRGLEGALRAFAH
jgi:hypothetical protein